MTRLLILFTALMSATSAVAHPGHLAEVAGHGHWLGAAAIGAAIAIGLWAAAKGRKHEDVEAEADDAEAAPDDAQEA
jgi:hydrogenase/urease accessory protein HupE